MPTTPSRPPNVLNGWGAPPSNIGLDNDFYIDNTSSYLYGPKESGVWVNATSLTSFGGTSTDNTLRNGSGPPSTTIGNDGDFYIDTASHVLYGPKTNGAWGDGFSLVGPSGTNSSGGDSVSNFLEGSSAIPAGATSVTVTTQYAGSSAQLRPQAYATSDGGLSGFNFRITSISSNELSNTSSFVVNVDGGTPTTDLTFDWALGVIISGINLGSYVQVSTIANLKALSGTSLVGEVEVLGYLAPNDGGGGLFYWDPTSTTADNTGTVISPVSAPTTGRWLRIISANKWNAAWFGFLPSQSAAANTTALNAAMTTRSNSPSVLTALGTGGYLYVNSGAYQTTGPHPSPPNVVVEGDGMRQVYITHTGNNIFSTSVGTSSNQRGWKRVYITGNSGASAGGIVIGDALRPVIEDVIIDNYSAGTGFTLTQTSAGVGTAVAGAQIKNLQVMGCLRQFAFTNTSSSAATFSGIRVFGSNLTTSVANGIGLYVGDGCTIQGSTFDMRIGQGAATSPVAISLNGSGAIQSGVYSSIQYSHFNINMESANPNPGTGISMNANDVVHGTGRIYNSTEATTPVTHVIPTSAVVRVSDQETELEQRPASVLNSGSYFKQRIADIYLEGQNTANPSYVFLHTIPATSSSSWDKLLVEFWGGENLSVGQIRDWVVLSNRGGFNYSYSRNGNDRSGNTRSYLRILGYSQVDGSINVYGYVAPSVNASMWIDVYLIDAANRYKNMFLYGGGAIQQSSSPPAGTLVFDTGSVTYPPNNVLTPGSISTGTINASSLAATGAVSGGSLSTSGSLSAGSMSTAGTLASGAHTVTGGISASGALAGATGVLNYGASLGYPLISQAYANITPVTVNTNTTSAQNLMSYSIPAGLLNTLLRTLRVRGAGVYTTQSAQTPTITVAITLGSITLITFTTTATVASTTNAPWNFEVLIVTASTGTTGTLETHGDIRARLSTAAGPLSSFADGNTAASSAIDLTLAQTLQVTWTYSTNAATANTSTQRQMLAMLGG